jgi:hypothetical protein
VPPSAEIRVLAHRVAEAHVDLRRVRSVRHQLLARKLTDPHYDSLANTRKKLALIRSLLRHRAPETLQGVTEFLHHLPQGPLKFAVIVSEQAKQLSALDRYERRALSRRKFAVRVLDLAKATSRLHK